MKYHRRAALIVAIVALPLFAFAALPTALMTQYHITTDIGGTIVDFDSDDSSLTPATAEGLHATEWMQEDTREEPINTQWESSFQNFDVTTDPRVSESQLQHKLRHRVTYLNAMLDHPPVNP